MLERFERFSFAISEISRCWRKLASDELAKYGLKSPHATYLTTMYKYPDGITVPNLCEICGKDKSDASRMIAILEEKGLACKNDVGGSLYRGLWILTDEGRLQLSRLAFAQVKRLNWQEKTLMNKQGKSSIEPLSLLQLILQY